MPQRSPIPRSPAFDTLSNGAERDGVGCLPGAGPKTVAVPSRGAGPRVLIVYGTTEGHTAKVAAAVAETLQGHGIVVEVAAAQRAPAPDGFDGVVVAASVHGGAYQRSVRKWVHAHASALNEKPSAFLSVCLAVLQRGPAVQRKVAALAERLFSASGWYPTMSAPVAGALPYSRYGWLKRRIMLRIVAGAGGDTDISRDYEYTDWTELRSFADRFASRVRERAPHKSAAAPASHDKVA